MLTNYWWQGIAKDVIQVVGSCEVCDRTRVAFNAQAANLNPLPISGLFYRWGIDLCGPFPASRHGNVYVMIAVEHYSRTLVLIPLPSKEAKHTCFAFEHAVLSRFGACAEVVTDQGTEFLGEFQACMARNFIDHRTTAANHPQANGLAERCVQTVKRCLRRYCEDSYTTNTWDEQLPYISLGYNCSKQKSTGCSPFQLLYAREPFIPSAVKEVMTAPLDFESERAQEQLAKELEARAGYLSKAMPTIASNLAIAQHRDSLRYAMTRSGTYLPKLRKFSTGDYVYLRRPNMASTLQIQARQLILRILELRNNGSVLLQGRCGCTILNNVVNLAPCHLPSIDGTIHPDLARPSKELGCEVCNIPDDEALMCLCDACGTGWHTYCLVPSLDRVPKGDFLCPTCTKLGITLDKVITTRAGRQLLPRRDTDNLFPNAAMRGKDKAAESYDGRLVRKPGNNNHGDHTPVWGTVAYRGADTRPMYFLIRYEDGTEEIMSKTTLAKRNPLAKGVNKPTGSLLSSCMKNGQYSPAHYHSVPGGPE